MTLKKEIALKVERCESLTVSEIYTRVYGVVPTYDKAEHFFERFINVNKYLDVRRDAYPMIVTRTKRNAFIQWIFNLCA